MPNQPPTDGLELLALDLRGSSIELGRPGRPNTVECASIDMNTIVRTVTSTKLRACSMLANRHQRRHRARFASVGSKTYPARLGPGLLVAGHRAHQPGDVAAHAEALVADPVALAQVLAAAGAGERDRAHHQREARARSGNCPTWVTASGSACPGCRP